MSVKLVVSIGQVTMQATRPRVLLALLQLGLGFTNAQSLFITVLDRLLNSLAVSFFNSDVK